MCCKIFNRKNSKIENDRPPKTEAEKLQLSVRVTAKCRFSAAQRLRNQDSFAFFATTFLSLELIFIPLMQNAGIKLAFSMEVLNMMSVFLAVAVLVYSVVIGTAKYGLRSDKLTQCGDNLKELNRKLGIFIENDRTGKENKEEIDDLRERYTQIISETENHRDVDYFVAILDMPRDYPSKGWIDKFKKWIIVLVFKYLTPYTIPLLLIVVEIIFICDMLFITEILPNTLRGR